MTIRVLAPPLAGRLVGLQFFWTLAAVLTCLVAVFVLFWQQQLTELAAVVVVAPLALACLGGVQLRRLVASASEIDAQLQRVGDLPALSDLGLRPVAGDNPAARGWNAVVARLRAAASLAQLESRLQDAAGRWGGNQLEQAFHSLPDGLAVTNADGRIVVCNKAFQSLARLGRDATPTGRRPEEALGLADAASADDLARLAEETLRPAILEAHYGQQLDDGVLRIARYPLLDADQRGGAHVWHVRDVTQQKLAEAMRNQFVFTATHELRTPLANIKAYAETLALHQDISGEQQREFYNTISAEATRLSRFVDELLNVSQMESGALSLTLQETDVLRLVEEVAEHVQPEMRRKEIAFAQQTPPKLPKILADKDKLAAALVNLLGNAAKYTPAHGQVRLHVEVDHRELHFHVEDTGFGIAAEELPKIFDKFFRSADDRVQSINGSGLGLAFTQEAARLHGGRITVHSELNKGSRFTLTLPLSS